MNCKKNIAVVFAIIIVALPITTAFSKKLDFSEFENRKLAALPKLSLNSVLDKSFMNGLDSYISDHFIGRDIWVQAKSKCELATLKKENNSILLTKKGTLVERLDSPEKSKEDRNIDGILTFAEKNPDAKIYTAVAPSSCEIYSELLPYGKKMWNQKKEIDSIYGSLSKSSYGIDLYSTLSSKKNQYIYYNTDHHWTSLGAYYAYTQIASALNFTPYEKSSFDIEHASDSFYGTYSSRSKISVPADTVDIFSPANSDTNVTEVIVNDGKKNVSYNSLYFRKWLDKKDKYSVFLGQVQPEITIKTNVKNNKKLLIFKDSYAHSLVPFLVLHFSEIKLIDLRYANLNYRSYAKVSDYDSVLLLYSIKSMISDTSISSLGE